MSMLPPRVRPAPVGLNSTIVCVVLLLASGLASANGPSPGLPEVESALQRSSSLPSAPGGDLPHGGLLPLVTSDRPHPSTDRTASRIPAGTAADFWLNRGVGTVYHVAPTASGTGSGADWANASDDLQAMIDAASAGDHVWMAAGVYRPGPGGDRTVSFVLKTGVAVYGGFAGTELPGFDLSERDLVTNETILSGDLLGDDGQQPVETDPVTNTNTADNAYSVVDASGVGAGTLLDGLTITAGRADVNAPPPSPSIRGGGIYMNTGTLTIQGCRFVGNWAGIDAATGELAAGGAALYVLSGAATIVNSTFTGSYGNGAIFSAGDPPSSVDVSFSDFTGNRTVYLGVAISSGGTLTVRDCSFTDNVSSESASAIYTDNLALVERSVFTRNVALSQTFSGGGAIYAPSNVAAEPRIDIIDCTFLDNEAEFGGAVISFIPFTIQGSTFQDNVASDSGGAIWAQDNWPLESLVDDCTFTGNTAGGGSDPFSGGGAIANFQRLRVANSTFTGNSISVVPDPGEAEHLGGGGAIWMNWGGQTFVTIEACDFIGNTATNMHGGAVNAQGSVAMISDCFFQNNVATYWGGGITSKRNGGLVTSEVTVETSRFEGNEALFGGGIMAYVSSADVTRCFFEANRARRSGGGMSVSFDNDTDVVNSVFLGNTSDIWGAGLFAGGGATPRLTNVTLTGNASPEGAAVTQMDANTNALFVNSILFGNPSGDGTPFLNRLDSPGSTGTLNHSLIEESACPPGVDCSAAMIFGTDPLFVAPNDLRLQPASLAIDTGTNVGAPSDDIDGNPRPLTVTNRADMGAYEFDGIPAWEDCNGNGIADLGELFADPTLDCNQNGVLDACENIVYSNSEFADTDWTAMEILDVSNGDATFSAGQLTSGGNPDSYRQTVHNWTTTVEGSSIAYAHVYVPCSYDPAAGAINTLDFSFDIQCTQAPLVGGVAYSPLVEQGGNHYLGPISVALLAAGWQPISLTSLTEADFLEIGGSGHPDFSTSGTPIRFGYVSSNGGSGTVQSLTSISGIDNWSVSVEGSPVTEVPPVASVTRSRLHPATPNPFNPRTTIRFDMPAAGTAELAIYDVSGRRVRTLVQGRRAAGTHSVVWSGLEDAGRQVASGVYLYRLRAGFYEETRRMVLLK